MKTLKLLGAALAAVTMTFSAQAETKTGVTVNGVSVGDNTSGDGWELSDGIVQLKDSGKTYVVSGTDTTKSLGVRVKAKTCTVKAVNLVLDPSGTGKRGAFVLDKDVSGLVCTFQFEGVCSFTSGETFAGLEVPSNAKIVISNTGSGDASLTANGGMFGAGIGGANDTRAPGEIVIDCDMRGTVEANGNFGAGIGGGMKFVEEWTDKIGYKGWAFHGGDCEKPIVINGGIIYARGSCGSAGIGGGGGTDREPYFDHLGGSVADIRINGGRVISGSYRVDWDSLDPEWSEHLVDALGYLGSGASIGYGSNAKYCHGVKVTGGTVFGSLESDTNNPGDDVKEFNLPEISGGSIFAVYERSNLGVNPALNPVYEVVIPVVVESSDETYYEVQIDGLYEDRGAGGMQPVSYGMKDVYALERSKGLAELYFHLPNGSYELRMPTLRYEFVVDSKKVEATALADVTLDANGGTCASYTIACEAGEELGAKLVDPTRSGWLFLGWFDKDEKQFTGSTRVYAHTKLTAKWKSSPYYTVTFDKCGGTGGDSTITVEAGVTDAKKIAVPSRDGYSFVGYYDSVDSTGIQYYGADGAASRPWDKHGDATLYARWTTGNKAKAKLSNAGKTLTFAFDGIESGVENTDWFAVDEKNYADFPRWLVASSTVEKVVFDDSFAQFRPTTCRRWFCDFTHLAGIEKMKENLNTSDVTDIAYMFYNCDSLVTIDFSGFDTTKVTTTESMFETCYKLKSLDLSRFNTMNVTNMSSMFSTCQQLTNIVVSGAFSTKKVTNSKNMFYWVANLKGGKGTPYSSGNTNQFYARIDGGPTSATPGYFTASTDVLCEVVDGVLWSYQIDNTGGDAVARVNACGPIPVGGRVVVPSKLGGYQVGKIFGLAQGTANKSLVDSLVIPEGVTQVANAIFQGYAYMKSVTLPASLTLIPSGAFSGCTSLAKVVLPAHATSWMISNNAFGGCTSLYELTIPGNPPTVNPTAFSGCTSLRFVYVDAGRREDFVTAFGSALSASALITDTKWTYGASGLSEVILCDCGQTSGTVLIPKWFEGRLVTGVSDYAFDGCTDVTEFEVDGDNAQFAVEDGVLYDKAKTKLIRCPPGKTGTVAIPATVNTIADRAFRDCVGVTAFDVASGNATFVSVDGVIYNKPQKDKLLFFPPGKATLELPSSLKNVTSGVFRHCKNLSVISGIGRTWTDLNAFLRMGEAPDTVVGFSYSPYVDGDTTYASIGCDNHGGNGFLTIPDTIGGYAVGKISYGVFQDRTEIRTVKLPSSLKEISDNAFKGCTGLESAELPSGLKKIGRDAFGGCTALKSVTIPAGVETMDEAFLGCQSLETVTIASGVTKVGYRTFETCVSLKSVVLPDTVTVIDESAFSSCVSLKSINLPAGLQTIGEDAFEYCGSLSAVDLPAGLTELGDGAFRRCGMLEAVTIPAGVATVGASALYGCDSLSDVTLSEGVKELGWNAFGECPALTSIELPASVTTLMGAFLGSVNLADISVSPSNPYFAGVDGVLYDKAMTRLEMYPPGRSGVCTVPAGVTTIASAAFSYSRVGSVHLSASVKNFEGVEMGMGPFLGAPELQTITVDAANPVYSSVNGILYNKEKTELVCCPMAWTGVLEIPSSVTDIAMFACAGCKNIPSVKIPKSVLRIKLGAFLSGEIIEDETTGITTFYVESGDRDRVAGLLTDSYLDVSTVTIIEGEPPPAGSYGIHFDANGGTGTMADLICARDKVYNLTKCAFKAPDGKAFAGWACKDTGRRYDDGVLVFDLAASGKTVTMTAVWK